MSHILFSISFQYMFILILVFLLETTVGSMSYVYDTQVEKELNRTLNNTFLSSYGVHNAKTRAIDEMQQEYKCCGAIRFEDWREGTWIRSRRKDLLMPPLGRLVPDSCCFSQTELCGQRDHPSNIPYTVSCDFMQLINWKVIWLNVLAGMHLPNDVWDSRTFEYNRSDRSRPLWNRGLWVDNVLCIVY